MSIWAVLFSFPFYLTMDVWHNIVWAVRVLSFPYLHGHMTLHTEGGASWTVRDDFIKQLELCKQANKEEKLTFVMDYHDFSDLFYRQHQQSIVVWIRSEVNRHLNGYLLWNCSVYHAEDLQCFIFQVRISVQVLMNKDGPSTTGNEKSFLSLSLSLALCSETM